MASPPAFWISAAVCKQLDFDCCAGTLTRVRCQEACLFSFCSIQVRHDNLCTVLGKELCCRSSKALSRASDDCNLETELVK